MTKIILLTGATDGIGYETAKMLAAEGHHLLLHGRSTTKLEKLNAELSQLTSVETYSADLSRFPDLISLVDDISAKHQKIDVIINNAGVLNVPDTVTADGFDVRFFVNTIAPYFVTKKLLPQLAEQGRVVNISSAAQAPVNFDALAGKLTDLDAMSAYSQSKLAITMWSRAMARALGANGPVIVAVNPGSLLGSKMVKQGFGIEGKDLSIGAEIIIRAALSDEFNDATGKYYDNDSGAFADAHRDSLDDDMCDKVIEILETVIQRLS